jgi:hypothetical protein
MAEQVQVPSHTDPAVTDLQTYRTSMPNRAHYYTGISRRQKVDAHAKDYIDAKVDAVRAQNDARFAEVMSALGGLKTEMSAQSEVARARFETTAAELTITREAAIAAKTAAGSAEAAAGTTKWNILFTGLTVLALIVGLWSIWGQAVEMTVGILGQTAPSEQSVVPAPAASKP